MWHTGKPTFIEDVLGQADFQRADAARRSGLRGGMAFPIASGGENVAVVELFSCAVQEPEPEMVDVTAAVGALIGEFIERLRAGEAVSRSEARKSALLASSLDAVIVMDHEGRVVEFNRAAEQIFERPAEEAVGAELAALVIPARAARAPSRGAATHRRDRRIGADRPADRADRDARGWQRVSGGARDHAHSGQRPSHVHRHGPRHHPAAGEQEQERDELLRLERLSRLDATEARDQLGAILSGIADAVTAQAPDGRLLFANDAAVELLGFESSEALLSAPLMAIMDRFDVLDDQGGPFPLDRLPGRRALVAGVRDEVVVRFRVRATGEERWSAVKATPIFDPDGAVRMAINVIEDITIHKRAERAQRFLSESTAVLGSSLDPEEVLGQVATLGVPEVADWLFVDLVTDAGVERVAVAHQDPDKVRRAEELYRVSPPDPNAAGGVRQVLRTGLSELHSDLMAELEGSMSNGAAYFKLAREFGMRSAVVVPMAARGRTLGALTLATDSSGRRFDERDLELAEELARRCATAIDNARLFSDRAYIARTLQDSLLPSELPDIPGIEAAARFRPTGEGNEVGGDFYDLFESGRRGWTVVMGDVCGKGPDAAAVTALARYTLRAAAMRERLPSRSLHILNEALLRQRHDRRFCTVAYAYLEKSEDGARVACASGGHPLPLLVRVDGTVEPVGAPGTLLGVLPDPRFEDRSVTLGPGDALVFYTDGVIEARSSDGVDGMLDEAGLALLLAACAGLGADAIATRVEEAAFAASGGTPRDDIAVLVLRVAA